MIKASLASKLQQLCERHEELSALLGEAEVITDQTRFRAFSREYAEIEPVVHAYERYCRVLEDIAGAEALLRDADPEMRDLAQEEFDAARTSSEALESELQLLLLPKDPRDGANVFLEVRAGTGGDEAAIFAGDLFRMYSRYADARGWQVEVLSQRPGEHGGFKEIIASVAGRDVFSRFKFESGVHRVQRVPDTEAQGRIHTSACTVAILPEVAEIEEVEINKSDLRVDTYRASGAGGQHVNRTDSAVRITHIPSGIVVECQDERSQHKNRARAMSLLASKLLSQAQDAQQAQQASERKLQVGSGDRSERIRTYNFPQGRVTDHRVNLTLYRLPEIVEGDLDCVIDPLVHEYQADQLAALGE